MISRCSVAADNALPEPNEYLNSARDIKEASEEIVSETGGSEFGAVSGLRFIAG
jgi:hypothetical protein